MKELIEKYQLEFAQMNRPFENEIFAVGYSKLEDATLRMMPVAVSIMTQEAGQYETFNKLPRGQVIDLIAKKALDLAIAALEAANEKMD